MLKNRRKNNDRLNKQLLHHNNYIITRQSTLVISSTIITTEAIIIRNIIAISSSIFVFRQIINEVVNMVKKVTITIFNFDIKILSQLINKILFQSISNNA